MMPEPLKVLGAKEGELAYFTVEESEDEDSSIRVLCEGWVFNRTDVELDREAVPTIMRAIADFLEREIQTWE